MPLIPFQIQGQPSYEAVFVNELLIDCIYHGRMDVIQLFCTNQNVKLIGFEIDPSTYPPDWAVFQDGNNYLVVIAGTTNKAQWACHLGSGFYPFPDIVLNTTVVSSFALGEALIEAKILNLIADRENATVRFTGHSYGAAIALIMAAHLNNAPVKPFNI